MKGKGRELDRLKGEEKELNILDKKKRKRTEYTG